MCHPGRDSGRLPSTNLLYRVQPLHRRQTGFPVSGARFWNSLPSHVTSAPSLAIFSQRLKTFLFHLSYPDLIFWFAPCFTGPSDNYCYLGHTKMQMMMTMMMFSTNWRWNWRWHWKWMCYLLCVVVGVASWAWQAGAGKVESWPALGVIETEARFFGVGVIPTSAQWDWWALRSRDVLLAADWRRPSVHCTPW